MKRCNVATYWPVTSMSNTVARMCRLRGVGLLGSYGESQWSLANFTVPSECPCVCAFAPHQSVTGNNIDEQRMILDPQRTLAFTICLHINATLNEVTMPCLQRCVSTVRTIATRLRGKVSATVWPMTSTSTSQRAWTSETRQ